MDHYNQTCCPFLETKANEWIVTYRIPLILDA